MTMKKNKMRACMRDPATFRATLLGQLAEHDWNAATALVWHAFTSAKLADARGALVRCAANLLPPTRTAMLFAEHGYDPCQLAVARYRACPASDLWDYGGDVLVAMLDHLPARQRCALLDVLTSYDEDICAQIRTRWRPLGPTRREDRLPLVLTRQWAFVDGGGPTRRPCINRLSARRPPELVRV